MAAREAILPAAQALQPLVQGDASSLCGLYSILNAVLLVLWPWVRLTRAQQKMLFRRGIAYLHEAEILPDILGVGMDEETWVEMSGLIVAEARKITGVPLRRSFIFRHESELTSRKALRTVRFHLRAGRPVILLIWGAYDHCTVAVGYTSQRLILFDSSGFKWLNWRSLGIHHPRSVKTHQMARWSAMTLARPRSK